MYYHDPNAVQPWQLHQIPNYPYPQTPGYWMAAPYVPCAMQTVPYTQHTPYYGCAYGQPMVAMHANTPYTTPYVQVPVATTNPQYAAQYTQNTQNTQNAQCTPTQDNTTDRNVTNATQYTQPMQQTPYGYTTPYAQTVYVQTPYFPAQPMLQPTMMGPVQTIHPNTWTPWNLQIGHYYPVCR